MTERDEACLVALFEAALARVAREMVARGVTPSPEEIANFSIVAACNLASALGRDPAPHLASGLVVVCELRGTDARHELERNLRVSARLEREEVALGGVVLAGRSRA